MIVPLIIFLLCALLIWRWKALQLNGLPKSMSILAFALKCVVGIVLWYMYAHVIDIERKDADIYKYFDDGLVMNSAAIESPISFVQLFLDKDHSELDPYYDQMYNWDRSYSLIQLNDNRTIIRLHALLAFVSGGNILAHIVFFNLIAFIGLLFLFKGFRQFTEIQPWLFIVVCIVPPSLLFWGSGLLKESLVLLPLGLSFYGASALYRGHGGALALVLGLLLFCFIKPYVLLSFLPLALYLLLRRHLEWSIAVSLFVVLGSTFLGIGMSGFFPTMDVVGILALKQNDFINVAMMSDAGSLVDIPRIDGFLSFVVNTPEAIFRTYLRPGLWEIRTGMDRLAALENTAYILLVLCAFIFKKKTKSYDLLMVCLLFLLGMGVLIGSVTPVLGAVVRYKVPALPFLMMAVVHMIDFNKLKKPFL